MSVDEANTDRRQLRDYLLGRLPEDLAVHLDSRLFADDVLRQELEEEQESLVEDFTYGRLSEEDKQAFQDQCSRSVSLREKAASLRILVSALERGQVQTTLPFVFRFKQVFSVLSPALALVLCFAAFLYIRERHRSAALVPQTVPPAATTTVAEVHPEQVRTVAFLSANVVRGSSSVPEIKIPPAGTILEIQVEVRTPPSSAADWDLALLRGSEMIQSSKKVPLRRLGQVTYLPLTVDAGLLHAGYYSIRYSPQSAIGVPRYRSFRGVN